MKSILFWLTVALTTVLVSACSVVGATDGGAGETEIRSGKIEQISLAQMQTNHEVVLALYSAVLVVSYSASSIVGSL